MWQASLDPWALLLFGRLGLGDKNQLLKKKKVAIGTEGNATASCMLSA